MRTKFFSLAVLLSALTLSAVVFAQTAPVCVVGKSGVAPTASITFTAPTTNTDGTPIATPLTYELFQGIASGQETLVAKGLSGSPISVTTGLADGETLYWFVEVVDANGNVSAPSNEVCKTFPAAVPSSVTITIS